MKAENLDINLNELDKYLNQENLYLIKRTSIGSYPGGKSDKKKHKFLYLMTPPNVNTIIEPFAGLASYSIVNSPKLNKAYLNDLDEEVYALLHHIFDKKLLSILIKKIQQLYPVSKTEYYTWKEKNPDTLLQKAIRRVIMQNCSFSGASGGYSKAKANRKWYKSKPKVWKKINQLFDKIDLELYNIEYTKFLEIIRNKYERNEINRNSIVYLDPPYFEVAENGNLYNFNQISIEQLKIELSKLEKFDIHWIMSNRDVKAIREEFSSYYQFRYNTYNDMANKKNSNPEILISNREFSIDIEIPKNESLDKYF